MKALRAFGWFSGLLLIAIGLSPGMPYATLADRGVR